MICNLLSLCGIVLITIAYASCYDFQNPRFNQILLDNIRQLKLSDAVEGKHSRVRRETSTSNATFTLFDQCCSFQVQDAPPYIKDDAEQCYDENRDKYKSDFESTEKLAKKYPVYQGMTFVQSKAMFNEAINYLKKPIACITQCIGQRLKLVDSNNTLILSELDKQMAVLFNNTWVDTKTMTRNCFDELQNKTKQLEKFQKENNCSIAMVSFSFCIYKEVQIKCPKEHVKKEALCDYFKSMASGANLITDALCP